MSSRLFCRSVASATDLQESLEDIHPCLSYLSECPLTSEIQVQSRLYIVNC